MQSYAGTKDWSAFSKALIAAKDPGGGPLMASSRLLNLEQGGRTLAAYYLECIELFVRVTEPEVMSQAEQVRTYLKGLAPPYKAYGGGGSKGGPAHSERGSRHFTPKDSGGYGDGGGCGGENVNESMRNIVLNEVFFSSGFVDQIEIACGDSLFKL